MAIQLNANHLLGGGLSYKHIGGNLYELQLIVIRDCNGGEENEFDNPASISLFDQKNEHIRTLGSFGRILLPYLEHQTITKSSGNCDILGGSVCFEIAKYVKEVELIIYPGGINLVYQRCCRPEYITNIEGGSNVGVSYSLYISEEALRLNNSGPRPERMPAAHYCRDLFTFDLGFADYAEQDDIVISFMEPFSGGDTITAKPTMASRPPYKPVLFKSGFSFTDFMGTGNPFSIDALTGAIVGKKTVILGQYVFGLMVSEYRKGVLLSRANYDFTVFSRQCFAELMLGAGTKIEPDNGNFTGAIYPAFDGNVMAHTFQWSNGSRDNHIKDLITGRYFLTVTDINSCEYEFDFRVPFITNTQMKDQLDIDLYRQGSKFSLINKSSFSLDIKIFNLNGCLISQINSAHFKAEFEMREFPQGLYTIQALLSNGKQKVFKIFL